MLFSFLFGKEMVEGCFTAMNSGLYWAKPLFLTILKSLKSFYSKTSPSLLFLISEVHLICAFFIENNIIKR